MREIKFRAWHKGYDRPTVKIPIKPRIIFDDKEGDCLKWKTEGQPVIVMQFTGLYDKNGKMIYEGDVVKARGKDRRDEVIGSIVFSDGEYLVETTQHDWPMASVTVLEQFEIVGNIYENPELLQPEPTYHIHKSYPWHCGSTTGIQCTDERMVDCTACLAKKPA